MIALPLIDNQDLRRIATGLEYGVFHRFRPEGRADLPGGVEQKAAVFRIVDKK
jgi:hypothetical protein